MTMQATDTSVRTSVVVEAPIERAFSVFTDDIGSWWPPEHHILEAELEEMVFEPRVGGHVYDRGEAGTGGSSAAARSRGRSKPAAA